MPVGIEMWITRWPNDEAGQDAAGKIWVAGVHSGIDDPDDDALTLAVAVRLRHMKKIEVPLSIPHRVQCTRR
jgi:hypothetical protein